MFVTGNSYNRGRWSNAEYDEAVKAASSTDAGDEQARWDDFQKAIKIISDDMGVVPVYQKAEGHLVNEKIKGILHEQGTERKNQNFPRSRLPATVCTAFG